MSKLLIAGILTVVGFVAGAALIWYKFPRTVTLAPKVETLTVEKEVVKERIVKQDGTVTERVITRDRTVDHTVDKTVPKPNYSLGLEYQPDISKIAEHQINAYEITAGYRLVGDLWATGTVAPLKKEISIGVRYEF